jgi:putative membrane protein
MDTPTEAPKAALNDYLAAERTFLAWIRTGLALMGFGFVVARFGLFLTEFEIAQGSALHAPHSFSLWSGTALIGAGIAVNVWSAWNHVQLITQLTRGRAALPRSYRLAVTLALFLALAGLTMALYLTLIR